MDERMKRKLRLRQMMNSKLFELYNDAELTHKRPNAGSRKNV